MKPMRPGLAALATAVALFPLSQTVAAQQADPSMGDFLVEVIKVSQPAGKAQAQVACTGLLRALRTAAADGSDAEQTFAKLEEDMAFFAVVLRSRSTEESQEEAQNTLLPYIGQVSAIYRERFAANQAANGELLDATVRENFRFCAKMRDEFLAALPQE